MVSVIVPVYNIEMYIQKCMDSVLKQDYKKIELIIIDDGSSDRTGEICKKYAELDERVLYLKKENEGQGIARTMGLKLAKGKYILFVDGDDWLEDGAIRNLVCTAEREDADIVVGDMWYVYNDGENLRKEYSKVRYEDGQIISCHENPEKINRLRTFTWGKLYKRSFLEYVGFEQGKGIYEDVASVPFLMAKAKKIVYISKPIYNYLKTRKNSSIHNFNKISDMVVGLGILCEKMHGLERYDMYENELARFVWSQVRFACVNNIKLLEENMEIYEKLISFLQIEFPKLAAPDECEIELINGTDIRNVLDKIVIFRDRIKETSDISDCTSRIRINYRDIEKTFRINFTHDEQDKDSWEWNCADKLFEMVWINYME